MKMLTPETQGSLYAIISGLLYGLVGYFGVSLMDSNLSIANMQFWRFFTSGLFMAIIIARRFQPLNKNTVPMLKAFLSGALFYSASSGIYFLASKYIGSGLSMVLFFTFPAMVLLLNLIFYRMKVSNIYYFAILLIVLGLTQLVDLGEMTMDLIGIGLAVLSGILYAFYIVASKNIKLSPMISALMVSSGCATSFFAFSLWEQTFIMPTTPYQWLHILGFGVISTAIPMLFLLEGLKKISAEKASILSVLEPVFVVIFGIILLEETLNLPKILGMITILAGALLVLLSNRLIRHPSANYSAIDP